MRFRSLPSASVDVWQWSFLPRIQRGSFGCVCLRCSYCQEGSVPDLEAARGRCVKCSGQTYAGPGDDACQPCSFPRMVLAYNWCTLLWFLLLVLVILLLVLFGLVFLGRLRLVCLESRLAGLIQAKSWEELHATEISLAEYGMWRDKANELIAARRAEIKAQSLQLGISLQYVFDELGEVPSTQ